MSGIVGIVNLDGAPVDHALLQRMTDFQSFRGPDAKQIWLNGNIGFGHTLLKTTDESEHEYQPFTLDGDVWIVADARVDAQRDLIAELHAKGQEVQPGVTDVELILRAYLAWGEDCVEHLLGDFTFGIWDGPQHRLFCARDQMGVKCFY
jgi:asparagine synthase (glutamine-hydrolysing)